MTSSSYFRYPHVHNDLVTFVAEDDVWVAPLAGGRAWRVSALQSAPRNPRFTPDGSRLVWTVTRGEAPEVVTAPVDGGDVTQLTYWGHSGTKVKGFTAAGDVLVTSAFEEPDSRFTWAYALAVDGSRRDRLPFGPVDSVAFGPEVGDERPKVISSVLSREPAAWKRYRGGTGGKLWIDADGSGEFSRLAAELDGNLCDPMWVGGRIAFLSDHEGHGNLYSVLPNGTELRRHTDHEGFYVRHAASDGTRIVFESAGNLFVLNSLDEEAVVLDITLGSASAQRGKRPLDVGSHLGRVSPDRTGRASVVETHGSAHWLTHRDGPARIIEASDGVRARLARPLDADRVLFVADHGGEEALYIRTMGALQTAPGTAAHPGDSGNDAKGNTGEKEAAGGAVEGADGGDDNGEIVLPKPVSAADVNAVAGSVTAAVPPAPKEAPTQASAAPAPSGPPAAEGTEGESRPDPLQRIDYPKRSRAAEAVPSPDGSLIAIGTEYGDVFIVDVAAGSMREISHTDIGAVEELAFSPDSKWLVWTEPVVAEAQRSKLRLANVAAAPDADIVDLTDGRFTDQSADFTPDGKFIAFLSQRSFDPVYDTQSFDLSFPVSTKPFLLALAAVTPSPFGPHAEGAPVDGDSKPGKDSASGDAVEPVVVDREGLAGRLIAVPVAQGRYSALSAVDGALLWMVESGEGFTGDGLASTTAKGTPNKLDRFELATAKTVTVVKELDDYRLSGDRSRLAAVHDGGVQVVAVTADASKDSDDAVDVDLERIRVTLDPVKVWGQMFEEAWRLQRDFYYTADMAGTDWQGVFDRYRPLVACLGSHDDLVDLLWELHGELGTSHAYVTPEPITEAGAGAQGRLGADFEQTPDGWKITRILPGESSDPQAFSPLLAPGVDVRPGDILESVNAVPVPATGPETLLAGTAGKIVELTVRTPANGADATARRVAVVPIKSEERLRYQQWVAGNRALVRQASGGKFGYLHIPDMQARGWAQLHRDLDTETAADALIVDVRRNRGGHTSQLVAEVIGRRMDAWALARGQESSMYPAQAPRGPVVILTDEFAGSDGDIITAVAKLRGIGPVVGMRTWGGVVGIDGRFSLADGTGVTQPRYAFWFRDGAGFGVENFGVEPDIEVPYPPHDYASGNDPQLETAIGVLVEMQQEIPTVRPPELAGYRNVAPAKLPPRPQLP